MADPWREIEAEWIGETAFKSLNKAGVSVQMGRLGEQPGTSPMEMVLIALAGCTGMDVVDILIKERQSLEGLKIKVRGKRADSYPAVFTEIEVTYQLWGKDLKPKAIQRAITLSEEKYCSVSGMLKASVAIHSTYQIMNMEQGEPAA